MGLATRDGVSLSEDMFVEILTRLPWKSFSRSKCVSKSWQSLLSDDYVRNKLPLVVSGVFQHSNSTLKNGLTYVSFSYAKFESTCLDFFPFQLDSSLIDCSNGLLLFYSSPTTTFHICNPTIKKSVVLPKPIKETKLSILAFDPYHSQHFKVVNFTGWCDQGAYLEIFDSESGNWTEHKVSWGIDTNALSATMRYMEGVVYILAQPNQVVAIDLDDMTCRLIELPETVTKECCIGKVGGRLHYGTNDGSQLRIWMLEDKEDGGWMLKHCLSDNQIGHTRVFALHPERDMVYLWVKGKLVAYDVCEKRVEEAWELGKDEKGYLVGIWVFPFSRYLEDCLASRSSSTLDW